MADEKKDDLKAEGSTPAPLTRKRRRSHETQVLQPLEVINPGDLLEGSAAKQTPTAQQAMGYSAIIPADGTSEIDLLFAEVLPPSSVKASPVPPLTPPPRSHAPQPTGDTGSSELLASNSLDYHDYDPPPEDLSSTSQPLMTGAPHETAEMAFDMGDEITAGSDSTRKEPIPELPRDTAPIIVKQPVPQSIKTTSVFQIHVPVEPGDLIGDMIDSVMRDSNVAPTEKLPVHNPSTTTIKETTTFSLPVDLRSPEALIGDYLDKHGLDTDVMPAAQSGDTAPMVPVQRRPTPAPPSTPTPRTTTRTPHRETIIFGNGSTEDLDAASPFDHSPDAALRAVASSVTERDTDVHASLSVGDKPTDVIDRRKVKKPKIHAQGKGPRRYLPEVPPQDAVPTQQALQAVDTPVEEEQESVRDTQERSAPDSTPPPSKAAAGLSQDTLASPLQPRPTKPQSRIPFVLLKQGRPQLQSDLRPRYQEVQQLNSQHPDELTESVLCRDNDLQRMVIHKRLRPQLHTPTQIPRFMEQIQLRSQLDHPSIPPIYDAGVDAKGCYYYTEKYVSGDSLDVIIDKLRQGDTSYHKRFGARTRIEIITALIHVLRFAHAKGIVHGDLSPSCIIVGPFGDIALRGWELATQLQNHPEQPKVCSLPSSWPRPEQTSPSPFQRHICHEVGELLLTGTPAYLAPERLHGAPPDERSDVYSLCAIIYEFLTLHHYLEASRGNLDALLEAIQHKSPAPITGLNSAQPMPLPEVVTQIIARGLAKEPGQRPTRFESLYAAFHLPRPQQQKPKKLSPLLLFTIILCVGFAAYGALQLGLQAWSFWTGQP